MTERFEVGTGDKGLMIVDNEGVDDYYFVNDKEELQQFVDLINTQPDIVEELKKELVNRKNMLHTLGQDFLDLAESHEQLKEENKKLKMAILYFMDCLNCETSSNWQKSMERDCQHILNCSYKEAKEKYNGFHYNEITELYAWK